MPDFRSLQMNDVVIHAIPSVKRADRAAAPGPEVSDIPVILSSAGQKYLTERLIGALLKARPVKEHLPPKSPVPEQVRLVQADLTKLVEQSRDMATHLYRVESGRNSAGLMMAVSCLVADEQWIVVSKIEHEQGVQVEVEVNAAGERTFNLTYLDNLIVAETTKVYKIVAFPASTAQSGARMACHAADPKTVATSLTCGCRSSSAASTSSDRTCSLNGSMTASPRPWAGERCSIRRPRHRWRSLCWLR